MVSLKTEKRSSLAFDDIVSLMGKLTEELEDMSPSFFSSGFLAFMIFNNSLHFLHYLGSWINECIDDWLHFP